MHEMSRLIDIDNEQFWDVLFNEACVEGSQAERIEKELEKIIVYDVDKVVEQLEDKIVDYTKHAMYLRCCGISEAIEIVKAGGIDGNL